MPLESFNIYYKMTNSGPMKNVASTAPPTANSDPLN